MCSLEIADLNKSNVEEFKPEASDYFVELT